MRGWLGLHDQNNRPSPKVPPAQLLVTLEAQIQALELSLRTEQTLGQTALQELTKVRAQMSKIDVLEAELAIERESSSQLVQWLQEAEHELVAKHKGQKDAERGSDEMQSTLNLGL